MYKKLDITMLCISILFVIALLVYIDWDSISIAFEFVALDFSMEQQMFSRVFMSLRELKNLNVVIAMQYNLLPICFIVNSVICTIAFILNIGRWHNLPVVMVHVTIEMFVLQLLYTLVLNSQHNLMLLVTSGMALVVGIVLYLVSLLTCGLVKLLNPIRRGLITLLVGILVCYKSYLQTEYIVSLWEQVFRVIVLLVLLEIFVDFLNVMEKIIRNDKRNNKGETQRDLLK